MKKRYINEALKWLIYLRMGNDRCNSMIDSIRDIVREGKLSLTDIGTSEEELEQLRVKGCKVAALKWLGFLRNGTNQYSSFINYVRKEVLNGNLSLTDIGTSEEELEQLRIKGCKASALGWLNCLRNGTDQYHAYTTFVRSEVREGKLSLTDIGTSEEELEQLRVKGCKVAALKWLGFLRNITGHHNSFVAFLREEVHNGSLSLADLGTSEEELASLAQVPV